ncbi:hypothetical protein EDD85DRAFT_776134, partial [Armillaria nabsnona]
VLRRYSRNRTIPILDAVSLPGLKNLALIVMLMFHSFLSPPFHCRIEFVELLREFLAECIFMHSLNIAHRDISINNVVMDHRRVMLKGYHYGFDISQDGIEWKFPTERRCVAGAVDYYYIDFQFAQCFPERHDIAIISGIVGQCVPEMNNSDDTLYSPFKADVYQLCATVITTLNLCCRSMVAVDPSKRPTASDALAQFDAIVSRSSAVSMTWRIWSN